MHGRRSFLGNLAAGMAAGTSGMVQLALASGIHPIRPGMQSIEGEVLVNRARAREGMAIGPGDTVSTAQGARAIYVIGLDAYLQRGGAEVRFEAGATASVLRVITGGILSVFGKGEKQLITPTVTIGIRGTGCYIEAGEHRSYFCLCYGEADVTPVSGETLHVRTSHHENPLWIGEGAASRAEVVNHTDDELILLEELVGRRPPFYGSYGTGGRF